MTDDRIRDTLTRIADHAGVTFLKAAGRLGPAEATVAELYGRLALDCLSLLHDMNCVDRTFQGVKAADDRDEDDGEEDWR